MKRITILLAFGGESSEHEVSIRSARNVYSAIDKTKYDVRLAYIDITGRWWLQSEWSDTPDANKSTQLVAAPGTGYFLTVPGSQVLAIDVIFPILHGKHGEDGSIQGLADVLHIPIVGCGIEASALCMDKDATKRIAQAHDIPVVPWVKVTKGDSAKETLKAIKKLSAKGPWFVKPSRAGSSVGVSKVIDSKNLVAAIAEAHLHDAAVLIEIAIEGRELEIAVLGNPPHHKVSRVGEIFPGGDFYDYDAKYASTSTSEVSLKAKLSKSIEAKILDYAWDAYQALGCTGLARIDFLLKDGRTPYLNEVNTLPGFTDISMYPKLWEDKGVSYGELIDQLIGFAVESNNTVKE